MRSSSTSAGTKLANTPNRLSRRAFAGASGAAASALYLPGVWNPRRSYAAQATAEITARIFPFGVGVEELYQEFVSEFQAENPDVRVTIDLQPWNDRYPKMLADLAAGQGPDVMFVTTDVLIRFAQAEAITPLDDVLPASVWEGYAEGPASEVEWEGARWFTPYDQEVPLWMANLDILENAGIGEDNLPATWDDIRSVCEQVQGLGDAMVFGWGYNAASATLNTTFYPFLYQAGGRPLSEDGSEPTFNSEAGVDALSFIVELFEKEWASPEYLQEIPAGQEPFTQGRQAISNHSFAAYMKEVQITAPDLRFALTPVLRQEEAWGFGGMRSWAMSADTEHQEAAAAFMEFLTRPEIMLRHAEQFGVFPTKTEALENAYSDDPQMASLRDHLEHTFGEQKHRYGRDLMPLVTPQIQAAILGQKEPKQALDDAAAAVLELFQQG